MRFFPSYTFESVLSMRATQFFALNKQIGTLSKEEEAQQLAIHHNSKPGDRLKEIVSELNARKKVKVLAESSIALISRGEATGVVAAELAAVRERQKANDAEMKKDRAAWLEKVKAQIAAESLAIPVPEAT